MTIIDRHFIRCLWGQHSRPRADHCSARLQSLTGSTGSSCQSPVYSHGLWLQRVLAPAVAIDRHQSAGSLFGPQSAWRTVHHQLGLARCRSRLFLHAVLRASRIVSGALGWMARACWSTQGRFGLHSLLVWRHHRGSVGKGIARFRR